MPMGKLVRVTQQSKPKTKSASLAKRVSKLAELIGKPEVCHHSSYGTAIDVTDKGNGTNQIFIVNNPAQGDTDINRQGDKLRMLSLTIRGNLIIGDSTNVIRMVIFQWYSGSNSIPLEDVTEASDSSGRQWMSPYKHDHAGKFKILYDKTFNMTNVGDNAQIVFKKTVNFRGKNAYVELNNGTTTVNTNAVYVSFVSDSAAVSHPTLNYYYRLRFTDV